MEDLLRAAFGLVCGQAPAHTWSPDGWALPCCQRCVGLYAGACISTLIHLWKRPILNGRFLEAHGLMLLLMVPFGFHWIAQGPVLRAASGVLFGAGALTFLWLPLVRAGETQSAPANGESEAGKGSNAGRAYWTGLALTAAAVPMLGQWGGQWAGWSLTALATGGLFALTLAAAADLLIWFCSLGRLAATCVSMKRRT